MSDAGGHEEGTDYSKMKVNDLRKLLKGKGLPLTGTKQELVERLQTAETTSDDLLDDCEVGDGFDEELERELDESSLIGDDTVIEKPEEKDNSDSAKDEVKPVGAQSPKRTTPPEVLREVKQPVMPSSEEKSTSNGSLDAVEPPNTTQEKRKISLKENTSTASETAKKKLRAERFGAQAAGTDSSNDLLNKRAERFAINSTTTSTASDSTKVSQTEILKKRAERFGILSPAELKRQHLEKLQARKLRFSSESSTNSASTVTTTNTTTILESGVKPTQLSLDERKKLRAERFKEVK